MASVSKIVIILGVIFGCCAGIYMTARYLGLSQSSKSVEILLTESGSHNVLIDKLTNALSDTANKKLIMSEVEACYDQNSSFKHTMKNMVAAEKIHALWSSVISFIFAAMFGILGLGPRDRSA